MKKPIINAVIHKRLFYRPVNILTKNILKNNNYKKTVYTIKKYYPINKKIIEEHYIEYPTWIP
tara:strand:+ start:577 stop:765 length:189 start_codon:yes stop_codon:yes gene_type:complete